MEDAEIKENLEKAIDALKAETPALSFGSVHERSTAHRLAVHMEPLFNGYNIDCEYNRYGEVDIKKITGIPACNHRYREHRIFPDIIVHERGSKNQDNLLVVEMKNDAMRDECDIEKLKLFTNLEHFKYQLGLYININKGAFDCTWFKYGEIQNSSIT